MKRLFFLLTLFIGCIGLTGCNDKLFEQMKGNIAEIRYDMFSYVDQDVRVEFLTGQRESTYLMDGKSTDLVDFGILSFTFLQKEIEDVDHAKYILIVGTRRMDGDLIYNPLNGSFVVDIKEQLSADSQIIAKILVDNIDKEVALTCKSKNWTIDAMQSLKIVTKEAKNDLLQSTKNGTVEVYIKMTNEEDTLDDSYYWYVTIVASDGNRWSYLVDTVSGKIVAHN